MPAPAKDRAPAPQPAAVKAYLFAFNMFSALAWAYVLFLSVSHLFLEKKGLRTLAQSVDKALHIAQTAAVLEVVHAATGLVRSALATTFIQVASRIFVVYGIMDISPDAPRSVGYALAAVSWALVEVPRYLFYALSLVQRVPAVLTWLRYSLFAVLYPSGITGELVTVFAALPFIGEHRPLSMQMPNAWNLPFDYYFFVLFIIATYVPGSFVMYTHMLALRAKVLGGASASPQKKDQ